MKNITKSLAIILSFQSIAMPGRDADQRETVVHNVVTNSESSNSEAISPLKRTEVSPKTEPKEEEEEEKK